MWELVRWGSGQRGNMLTNRARQGSQLPAAPDHDAEGEASTHGLQPSPHTTHTCFVRTGPPLLSLSLPASHLIGFIISIFSFHFYISFFWEKGEKTIYFFSSRANMWEPLILTTKFNEN